MKSSPLKAYSTMGGSEKLKMGIDAVSRSLTVWFEGRSFWFVFGFFFVVVVVFVFDFQDRVFLGSPGCPGTHL
jgi:hypothetical protein